MEKLLPSTQLSAYDTFFQTAKEMGAKLNAGSLPHQQLLQLSGPSDIIDLPAVSPSEITITLIEPTTLVVDSVRIFELIEEGSVHKLKVITGQTLVAVSALIEQGSTSQAQRILANLAEQLPPGILEEALLEHPEDMSPLTDLMGIEYLIRMGRLDIESCDPKRVAQYLRHALSRLNFTIENGSSLERLSLIGAMTDVEDILNSIVDYHLASVDDIVKFLIEDSVGGIPEYIINALAHLSHSDTPLATDLLRTLGHKIIEHDETLEGINPDLSPEDQEYFDSRYFKEETE